MTSECKIRANRANAKLSTGPHSVLGLRHSSQNARRHGLNGAARADTYLTVQIQKLATAIAGQTNDLSLLAVAERFAETQVDLERVLAVKRSATLELAKLQASAGPAGQFQRVDELLSVLVRLNRYENRASARRRKAIKALDAARATQLTSRPIWQNEAKIFNENKEAK